MMAQKGELSLSLQTLPLFPCCISRYVRRRKIIYVCEQHCFDVLRIGKFSVSTRHIYLFGHYNIMLDHRTYLLMSQGNTEKVCGESEFASF